MEDSHEDDDLPDLTERLLMSFAPAEAGWGGVLAALPDVAVHEIRNVLENRLPAGQVWSRHAYNGPSRQTNACPPHPASSHQS